MKEKRPSQAAIRRARKSESFFVAKLAKTERRRAERGACIKCVCTDHRACDEGCYWVSTKPPICSSCA
jgi:hypothetical protein